MPIPNISDVSAEYSALKSRDEQLRLEEVKIEVDLQELYELLQSGHDPDRDKRVATLARGETITDVQSVRSRYENGRLRWADVREARRVVQRQMDTERRRASDAIRDKLRPQHNRDMQALSESLLKAHTAFSNLYQLRASMTAQGIGLGQMFEPWPEFLESPLSKSGALVEFLNDAASRDYCLPPKGIT
jgi:hypothetical protein